MSENKKILKAATVISSGTMLSRIFGYIRDMVIATTFGAGLATDAFFIAFMIPNLLRRLLGEGALSAAFVPSFTEYHANKSEEEGWKFANAIISTLIIVLSVIVVFAIVFMPWIVNIFGWGFRQYPEKFSLTILLTRITFPYIFLISLTAVCMGILNSLRHFIVPAFAPVLLNFSLIGAAFFICPYLDPPISGLAIGVIIGGFLQLLFHIIALKNKGMHFSFDFSFSHPGIKKVLLLMAPFVIGLSVTQINITVDKLLASFLDHGSISWLYYADRIVQLPLGVFGTAIGTAILPSLSRLAAKKDLDEMKHTISFGLRFTLFITIPAMIGQIVLALPIVKLLFERGSFENSSSIMTANALIAYSVGLWAFASIKVLAPVYYSMKDTKTPVRIAVISMVFNIIMNLILMGPLEHVGIALSTTLSSILNVSLLVYFLENKIGKLEWKNIIISTTKIISASIAMGLTCYFFYNWGKVFFTNNIFQGIFVLITVLTGIISYFFSTYILKCGELHFIVDSLRKLK